MMALGQFPWALMNSTAVTSFWWTSALPSIRRVPSSGTAGSRPMHWLSIPFFQTLKRIGILIAPHVFTFVKAGFQFGLFATISCSAAPQLQAQQTLRPPLPSEAKPKGQGSEDSLKPLEQKALSPRGGGRSPAGLLKTSLNTC